jgi:hypothetical protein
MQRSKRRGHLITSSAMASDALLSSRRWPARRRGVTQFIRRISLNGRAALTVGGGLVDLVDTVKLDQDSVSGASI